MQILPAIDLRGGKCVNLVQGIAEQETVFSDAPVEMALQWQAEGAEYLHLVDLDGAFQNESANLDIVNEIVAALEIPVQLGGGIRNMERLDTVLALGVDRAILGTVALKQPDFVKQACANMARASLLVLMQRTGWLRLKDGWRFHRSPLLNLRRRWGGADAYLHRHQERWHAQGTECRGDCRYYQRRHRGRDCFGWCYVTCRHSGFKRDWCKWCDYRTCFIHQRPRAQ